MGAPKPTGRIWLILFPLAQAAHAIEEYWQGYAFHRWLRTLAGEPFRETTTAIVHGMFVLAFAVAVALTFRFPKLRWMIPAMATLVLLNSASHVLAAAFLRSALSGLVSSILLWLPLGVFAVVRTRHELTRSELWHGIAAGFLVQLPITWIAASALFPLGSV